MIEVKEEVMRMSDSSICEKREKPRHVRQGRNKAEECSRGAKLVSVQHLHGKEGEGCSSAVEDLLQHVPRS